MMNSNSKLISLSISSLYKITILFIHLMDLCRKLETLTYQEICIINLFFVIFIFLPNTKIVLISCMSKRQISKVHVCVYSPMNKS